MSDVGAVMIVSDNVLTFMDIISFSASVLSLVLAWYAIGLAKSSKNDADASKRDADKVNQETHKMLLEIKAEAMGMSEWGRSEITASSNVMRNLVASTSSAPQKPSKEN